MKSEKDVKREIKKLLHKHKWFWWMPPANTFGRTGISDFHALRAGVFMAIEAKFGDNEPTAMQSGFLESIQTEDGFAFKVNDRNLLHFEAWLLAFDRSIQSAGKGEKPMTEDGAMLLNCIKEMMP